MDFINYNKITFVPDFDTKDLEPRKLYHLTEPKIHEIDGYSLPTLDFSQSNIFMKRLYSMHEVHIYRKINDMGISPRMIDYGELHGTGTGILVLEKMEPLRNVINKLTNNEMDDIINSLINKVGEIHRLGIIHRDLRMDNLLHKNGEVFLCDFEDKGYSDEWAAPEVLEETKFSFESDIYSMGCTIYEIITGERPWNNVDNFEEYVMSHDFHMLLTKIENKGYSKLISDCLLTRCVSERNANSHADVHTQIQ